MVLGAACCAALFVLINAILMALAGRAARPGESWPGPSRDFESLLVDAAGLCAGVLVTIACTFSWVMLVVALPPVILLQRSLLHQQLRAAAQSDPKTGLLNAVAWQRDAERWIRRARRLSVPAAILLVDIDHFKRVNDTYGHLAGDELLAATASTRGQHVRACDVLGRFGGEEFVARTARGGAAGSLSHRRAAARPGPGYRGAGPRRHGDRHGLDRGGRAGRGR